MQHQLLERLQVIDSKEETCKNARYEQTTLENFRYMLDSKIESLEGKKKEMMDKIAARENDLKNMFNELIKESEENEKKYFELKQLNGQIHVLENEIKGA
jgi:peptidoglycan hydrolase CwlO-like protein